MDVVIEHRAYTENVAAQEAAYWYCREHGIHANDLDIGQILQVAGPIILQGAVEAAGPPLTIAEWKWIRHVAGWIAERYDDEEALPIAHKVDAYLNPSDA